MERVGGIVFKFITCLLRFWALTTVHRSGSQWHKEIADCDVHTIQDEHWGLVTILIPRHCSKFEHPNVPESNIVTVGELSVSMLGLPYVRQDQEHAFVNLLQLHRCAHKVTPVDSGFDQYHFSTTYTGAANLGVEDLYNSRMRFFWLYATATGLFLFTDLFASVLFSNGAGRCHLKEKRGWGNYVANESWMRVVKMVTAALQTYILSPLFITFWKDDHYVMSYVPGHALIVAQMFLCCFVFFSNKVNALPWIRGCALYCLPLILLTTVSWVIVYNAGFLMEAVILGELNDKMGFMQNEEISQLFVGFVIEAIVLSLNLDSEEPYTQPRTATTTTSASTDVAATAWCERYDRHALYDHCDHYSRQRRCGRRDPYDRHDDHCDRHDCARVIALQPSLFIPLAAVVALQSLDTQSSGFMEMSERR